MKILGGGGGVLDSRRIKKKFDYNRKPKTSRIVVPPIVPPSPKRRNTGRERHSIREKEKPTLVSKATEREGRTVRVY